MGSRLGRLLSGTTGRRRGKLPSISAVIRASLAAAASRGLWEGAQATERPATWIVPLSSRPSLLPIEA